MPEPFHSVGGGKAYLREQTIVVQDRDDRDVIRIGRSIDGEWTVTMLDAQGQERVRIGQLADEYGLRVRNKNGVVVYEVDNEGQTYPHQLLPMGSTGGISGMAITSGTFGGDGVYLVDAYFTAPRVTLAWTALFPGGHSSTMDVRTRMQLGNTFWTLDSRPGLATSTTGTVDADVPPQLLGQTARLIVDARRASGADLLGLNIALHPRNYG